MHTREILYLDHAAATPVDPVVFAAMQPYMTDEYGNPSSLHAMGERAKKAIHDARETVAGFLKARPDEIIFTSGGTEANNLALLGYARANKERGTHLITTAIEHHSVLHALRALTREGFTLTELPVDADGFVDPAAFADVLTPQTLLASIGYANNEIGTIQPIKELSRIARKHNVFFHTDAVQAAGALSLDVGKLGVAAMSLTGSKIYGPKGIGMLWVRKGETLTPLMYGGGQQRGLRPGTEHVAGIVGFAEALRISQEMKEQESERLTVLREELFRALQTAFPHLLINGPRENRLPNNINVTIPGADGEAIVIYASQEGLMLSTGSACSTVDSDPSHVLLALGRSADEANASIRITLGRSTNANHIPKIVQHIQNAVRMTTE